MENNEIMDRLLQDDKQVSSKTENVKQNKNWEDSISRVRVVTAKYKVYIVLIAIFIFLLFFSWIPNARDSYDGHKSTFIQVNNRLKSLKSDIEIAKQDMAYLCDESNWVIANEWNLRECLNDKNNCSTLPESWKKWEWDEVEYDYIIPLSYLQLHSLFNKKMPVDEKRVLKNLNEYLIKQDIVWWGVDRVWEILRIEIWDPEEVNNSHFFKVDVNVEIKFKNVSDLVEFLYNVEKKLIEKGEDRILYKIQTVSYDIVTNDEPQVTDISMTAYYYHDDRFDGEAECENLIENESISTDDEGEDLDNSESFFDKIFSKFK